MGVLTELFDDQGVDLTWLIYLLEAVMRLHLFCCVTEKDLGTSLESLMAFHCF